MKSTTENVNTASTSTEVENINSHSKKQINKTFIEKTTTENGNHIFIFLVCH